jgi:hypothetical protein
MTIGRMRRETHNVNKLECAMPVGDIAFLALVIGSMVVFAGTLGFYGWYAR